MKQCLRITITGTVQGVGYREFVKKNAEQCAVEGTIKNSENGSVIICACGLSENLDKLIDNLYKGSSKSEIKDISIEPFMKDKDFRSVFRVIGSE